MAAKGPRISNDALLRAGLDLMRQNGNPLTRAPSRGRQMIFKMPGGETVRVRTCNDHILIVLAEMPDISAPLNIEGTDHLLIVMPEHERTHGKVIAYLVPTEEAANESRNSHERWRRETGRDHSQNCTRNLWFDGKDKAAHGYAKKWDGYRLKGNVSTLGGFEADVAAGSSENKTLTATIGKAQREIANAAGVAPEAVKISIDFAVHVQTTEQVQ